MKKIEQRVNIIPIIAKSDTIAKNELAKFKENIMQTLKQNNVRIYQFPTDDDAVAEINSSMNVRIIFLIILTVIYTASYNFILSYYFIVDLRNFES